MMSPQKINWAPLLAAATPAVLPPLWRRFPCHPAFVQLPDEPVIAQLVAALRREAGDGPFELPGWLDVATGPTGQPRLAPALRSADNLVMLLESRACAGTQQVYSGAAWSGAPGEGMIAPLGDARAPRPATTEEKSTLFVAFSLTDLACLWSIGLPAVLGTELASVDTDVVERLALACQALQRLPVKPSSEPSQSLDDSAISPEVELLKLVFVDFDLATLEPVARPALSAVLCHLQQMLQCCDVLLELSVWHPAPTDLDCLRYAVRHGRADDVQYQLVEGVGNSAVDASEPPHAAEPPITASPPLSYVACLANWEAAERQHVDRAECERRWHALHGAWSREFVEPLLHQAAQEAEVLRKGHWALLADQYAELFLWRHPAPTEQQGNRTGIQGAVDHAKRAREVIHQIQELSEELRAWRIPTSSAVMANPRTNHLAAPSKASVKAPQVPRQVAGKPR